jgi:hypothetical protein
MNCIWRHSLETAAALAAAAAATAWQQMLQSVAAELLLVVATVVLLRGGLWRSTAWRLTWLGEPATAAAAGAALAVTCVVGQLLLLRC